MEENQNQTQQEAVKAEEVKQEPVQKASPATEQAPVQGQSKTFIGVVCGLFLGLWGLLIGFLCFKEGTVERKTFFKGYIWAFVGSIVAAVVISVLVVVIIIATGALAGGFMY